MANLKDASVQTDFDVSGAFQIKEWIKTIRTNDGEYKVELRDRGHKQNNKKRGKYARGENGAQLTKRQQYMKNYYETRKFDIKAQRRFRKYCLQSMDDAPAIDTPAPMPVTPGCIDVLHLIENEWALDTVMD